MLSTNLISWQASGLKSRSKKTPIIYYVDRTVVPKLLISGTKPPCFLDTNLILCLELWWTHSFQSHTRFYKYGKGIPFVSLGPAAPWQPAKFRFDLWAEDTQTLRYVFHWQRNLQRSWKELYDTGCRTSSQQLYHKMVVDGNRGGHSCYLDDACFNYSTFCTRRKAFTNLG